MRLKKHLSSLELTRPIGTGESAGAEELIVVEADAVEIVVESVEGDAEPSAA
jgi:hypothetical protein